MGSSPTLSHHSPLKETFNRCIDNNSHRISSFVIRQNITQGYHINALPFMQFISITASLMP